MLSESQNGAGIKKRAPKMAYPMLDAPKTVRVRFCKLGNLQYISHLDLQRTVSRVLVRAGIPMWYTQGFNPHAKVTFALPLSVGTESRCEMIDLRIERRMSCEEIRERLNEQLTEEMSVQEVYEPDADAPFQKIGWASYEITISDPGITPALAGEIERYLTTPPLTWEKKSKSGVRTIEMTALIRSLTVSAEPDGTLRLRTLLSAAGADYLNPEYLIDALRARFGILGGDPMEVEYRILRTQVYGEDGVTVFR